MLMIPMMVMVMLVLMVNLVTRYTSLDRRREEPSSPPKSPPPFSKAESRFEREQRIKVENILQRMKIISSSEHEE